MELTITYEKDFGVGGMFAWYKCLDLQIIPIIGIPTVEKNSCYL